MFKTYSAIEYLCIDIANAFGNDPNTGFRGDKEIFETRIQWVKDNVNVLEERIPEAEEKYLYIKAVMALRDVQQGKPIGHMIMLDAACSGLQIMSALTGCIKGSNITCLVDPESRKDAYKEVTDSMNNLMRSYGIVEVTNVQRKDAKQAVMTAFYGSKAEPLEIFGEELVNVFYDACDKEAPGASKLLDDLINAWNKNALHHAWQLPDGFVAYINVMQTVEKRIEVDELGGHQFDTKYKVNLGTERGVSLAANVVHSIDAYLLRSVIRRCNYNPKKTRQALGIITAELNASSRTPINPNVKCNPTAHHSRYVETNMVDITTLYMITKDTVGYFSIKHLTELQELATKLLQYKPFPVMTVHDAFRVHPNNGNALRYWYKETLAELAQSTILNSIMSVLYRKPIKYPKLSNKMPAYIRNSNYAIS